MKRTSRIYVAGGDTLIGAAFLERLRASGYEHLVGTPPDEPDLTDPGQVEDFFAEARPEYVCLAAGKSGGIHANRTCPADLMRHNLLVTAHVVHAAHEHGVHKLLYLASSCSYPRNAPQPLRVEALLTGLLEPTSEAYALAKLAGLRLCRAYREQYGDGFVTGIPANAFGPHDDFSPQSGHVIPGLIRKFHEAKVRGEREVAVWGTGTARREFIYARDLADACLLVMARYDAAEPINLGGGAELAIADVARTVAEVVGYTGRRWFDTGKPDGAPLKALDSRPLHALGFRPRTSFRTALEETYDWFQRHVADDTGDLPTALPGAVPRSAA
jgi:GDP-L-fucose synthase